MRCFERFLLSDTYQAFAFYLGRTSFILKEVICEVNFFVACCMVSSFLPVIYGAWCILFEGMCFYCDSMMWDGGDGENIRGT